MKFPEVQPGQQLEKMHTVLEIGASPGNEYYVEYGKPLASSQHYELANISYHNLPGGPESGEKLLPYEDNSIDEIVISNVLSDLGYQPIGEDQKK